MNDTAKSPIDFVFDEIRRIVREETRGSIDNSSGDERLLSAEEAAQLLSVSPDWLYRHSKKLPFTRRLGPKALRFSHKGILKWLESRCIKN